MENWFHLEDNEEKWTTFKKRSPFLHFFSLLFFITFVLFFLDGGYRNMVTVLARKDNLCLFLAILK